MSNEKFKIIYQPLRNNVFFLGKDSLKTVKCEAARQNKIGQKNPQLS